MMIETVSHPGSSQSGNTEGQILPACYTARNSSIACADTISGAIIDGDINLSVSIKTSQSATVNETPLPSRVQYMEDPVVKMIMKHKVELIDCLRADCNFILQHVHARDIVTDRQYQNLKCVPKPEESIINLIDQVIAKGQESCSSFGKLLKEPEVLKTYPQLKEITKDWF
ncbi:uncharacterized protein LOC113124004 isoform X2 [Mastacembelus armatus]|nr:uncharacterized protein LOC113124004 isoform X2 [Mastacembelus armatus]